MIDNGDGNGNGSSINKFAESSPNLIFGLLQKMQALGLSLPEILSQLGVETDDDGNYKLSTNGDSTKEEPKPKIDKGNQS